MKKMIMGILMCLMAGLSFAQESWIPQEYEYKGIFYHRGQPAEGEETPEMFLDLDGDGQEEAVVDFGFAYKEGQEPEGHWGAVVIYDQKKGKWAPVKTFVSGDHMCGYEFMDVDHDGTQDLVMRAYTGNHYMLITIYSFKDGDYKKIFENGTACYLHEIDAGSNPTKIVIDREDWDNNDFDYASSAELSLKEVYVWDGKEFVYSEDLSTTPWIGEKQAIEDTWRSMKKIMREANSDGEAADSLQVEYTAKRWTAGSRVAELFEEDIKKAVDQMMEDKLSGFYEKAETAVEKGNIEKADFWMARYIGLTSFNEKTEKNYTDLYPLFKKREDLLKPTAFISGKYSEDFIDFFLRGMNDFWGIPEEGVIEEDREFAVRTTSNDKYFVQLVISPRLETWYILKEGNPISVIPLISFEKSPFIVSGIIKDGEPEKYFDQVVIDTDEHFLHYIWPVEFHDLDNDQIPEIWLRYNKAWADGFSQVLDIYKIENDEKLVLLKRFEGNAEGIARRVGNNAVEVGEGFTEKEATGHLGYDQHHIETFEFKDGEFTKIAERNVPHLLWGDDWIKYYFNQDQGQE
jgi:hypothetical protein